MVENQRGILGSRGNVLVLYFDFLTKGRFNRLRTSAAALPREHEEARANISRLGKAEKAVSQYHDQGLGNPHSNS